MNGSESKTPHITIDRHLLLCTVTHISTTVCLYVYEYTEDERKWSRTQISVHAFKTQTPMHNCYTDVILEPNSRNARTEATKYNETIRWRFLNFNMLGLLYLCVELRQKKKNRNYSRIVLMIKINNVLCANKIVTQIILYWQILLDLRQFPSN